jgi:DeoR/GlpR family transcriptional regulator of sugar metabolism
LKPSLFILPDSVYNRKQTKTNEDDSGMNSPLFPEIRRREILKLVDQTGQISVRELSRQYNVSEVTIRSDLEILAEKQLIERTHGGAMALNRDVALLISHRRSQQVEEKERIGAYCASLVENGDSIFLDISTTALALSYHLKDHQNLTVVTNSFTTAQELVEAEGVNVLMPGGNLRKETLSITGMEGLKWLQGYHFTKGFFGAHGITVEDGLTDVSLYEAEVKKQMVKQCKQVIGIFDATKWGRVGFASFATLNEVDFIVTDTAANAELVDAVRNNSIDVILV